MAEMLRVLSCKPVRQPKGLTAIDRQLCPPESGQQFAVVTVTQASTNTPDTPLDINQMAGFWMLALATVVGLYVVSAHAGAILGLIRRG